MGGVEGRRVVVGREGSPALVGLGTSVSGVSVLPGGGVLRQSLGQSRGVDEREADECRLDPRVRKWCLGVTEALGGSPWVAFMAWDEDSLGFPVFRQLLNRREPARRC